MRRFLPYILFVTAVAASADPFLLQSENLTSTDPLRLDAATEGGYEGGSIPDWAVLHRLDFGLPDRWSVGLEAAWGGFPNQNIMRVDTIGAVAHYGLFSGSPLDLQAYAKASLFLGDPISVRYTGTLPGVKYVLSPRAEGGYDLSVGAAARFRPRIPVVPDLSFLGNLDMAFTGGRNSFTDVSDMFRLYADLCPSYQVLPSLSLLLQNRVTWWFGRGFMYCMIPQADWTPLPGLDLAAGVGIPLLNGGGVWCCYAGIRWTPARNLIPNALQGLSRSKS